MKNPERCACNIIKGSDVCQFCQSLPDLTLTIDSYSSFQKITNLIDGRLYRDEDLFLMQLAKECVGLGCITELGTFKGKSTVSLALGVKGRDTKIFAVDHFRGDVNMTDVSPEIVKDLTFNLTTANVLNSVQVIVSDTVTAAQEFKEAIELLFVDANHEYPAVKQDFDAWSPLVVSGGRIAFHDTFDPIFGGVHFTGPITVAKEACDSPDFTALGRFQTITVLRRN